MRKCKNCEYYRPCEDKVKRGVCVHPERNDSVLVYYFGSLKETSYCALFELADKTTEKKEGK